MVEEVKDEKSDEKSDKKSIIEAGFRWLLGQEANTVLLFIVIIGLGYGTRYLVPQHLQMIQDGYEKLDSRHMEEIKSVTQHHTDEVKALATSFDKSLDRIERIILKESKAMRSDTPVPTTPPTETAKE